LDEATDYEKAVSLIDSAGAAQAEAVTVAIDLEGVFANKMGIRTIDYAEVGGLLESLEAKKVETASQPASKQKVQESMALGRRIVSTGISGLGTGLGRAAGLLGKGFGEAEGSAIASEAAEELGRIVKSVGREFGEAMTREARKTGTSGLVLPGLSLQDQLSELEQIGEGIDGGTFNSGQMETVISEIKGLDEASKGEDTGRMSEEDRKLAELRKRKLKDIKGKLNIK
jgi:hypothetical protein